MERRIAAERRLVHIFVSDERREGPYDRRGADTRRLELVREKEKMERIRAFKDRDKVSPPTTPLITTKRLVYLCLALLITIITLLLNK